MKITLLASLVVLLVVSHHVSADPGQNLDLSLKLENPLGPSGVNTISDFVRRLLDIVLTIGIPVITIFIIYSGFLFVTARGKEEAITKAKENLLTTIIGAAILLGAWVLAQALGSTINELQQP